MDDVEVVDEKSIHQLEALNEWDVVFGEILVVQRALHEDVVAVE